jgi:hypothetical protein
MVGEVFLIDYRSRIGRSQVSYGVGGDEEPRIGQPGSGGRAELGRANMNRSSYFSYRGPESRSCRAVPR